jgi:hypothetical protein
MMKRFMGTPFLHSAASNELLVLCQDHSDSPREQLQCFTATGWIELEWISQMPFPPLTTLAFNSVEILARPITCKSPRMIAILRPVVGLPSGRFSETV